MDKAPTLRDALHRPLRDLRISVTDRCNLRCPYCMPRETFDDHQFLARAEILSFEEIVRLAGIFVNLGVRKIRLSGGEPLLRRNIERLVERLARLRCLDGSDLELALTTNGVLLADKARALREAGLDRVTVSLDALSEQGFRRMSDSRFSPARVLEGIARAQAVGLGPMKVNCVVRRQVNEDEILPLLRHFRHSGVVLRFIEYMDVGGCNEWRPQDVISAREILDRIGAEYPLRPLEAAYPGEVSQRWALVDGSAEIGVVASVSQPFCGDCNRLRLATDGKLYTCLFARQGLDLRAPLRAGEVDAALAARIASCWQLRDDQYSELRHIQRRQPGRKIEMSYIGG
ncbi:MAG: GTP 3',8-cyclase MoaA [Candidatus Dactylopiibacterium carminicum]|uniref:GTP 3',8-cyclase n=1 Tax=Candidatus Dactylopiibacterium carminicum TaxID=857335 RepID=A0A272EX25_9RHOO|nr:GTP 3',8-cyclase MoaA [Candidatus Dactylopiibacterium carminicum]KAF7600314.1 GTP 3',8-cyclase MoaA [Candidatus Dactylopiibacterium carminicum]PAS94664.1 MAG: GTP 3',8-cyclase MoaA [Candidatus Dactylopiibacterium carminicum]